MPALRTLGWTLVGLAALAAACNRPAAREAAADSSAGSASGEVIATSTPTADTTVSWSRLTDLLSSETSRVIGVRLGPGPAVAVRLRDGRVYHAVEPAAGAAERVLKQVDPSGQILVARN